MTLPIQLCTCTYNPYLFTNELHLSQTISAMTLARLTGRQLPRIFSGEELLFQSNFMVNMECDMGSTEAPITLIRKYARLIPLSQLETASVGI